MTKINETRWRELVAGVDCPLCLLNGKKVIGNLTSGRVEFVADADFVGYCILVHRRHVIELFELTQEERDQYINDMSLIAGCMKDELHQTKSTTRFWQCSAAPSLHIFPRHFRDGKMGRANLVATDHETCLAAGHSGNSDSKKAPRSNCG